MGMKVYAIILAGGIGARLGNAVPKQYLRVNGRMIIEYCMDIIASHEMIDGIQVVVSDEWKRDLERIIESFPADKKNKFTGFSIPGENRQLSIYHALQDLSNIADADDCIMIHDAARPLLQAEQISACVNKLVEQDGRYDGVMPVLPMKDTVYLCENGESVSSLLNREQIFAGQAPEFFRYGKYFEANKALLQDEILKINGSTEPAIMAGMNIAMVEGDEGNFKITTAVDLERFREVIERSEK